MLQVVLHFLIGYGKNRMWYRDTFFSLRWCHVGWFAVSSWMLRNVRVSVCRRSASCPYLFFFFKCGSGPESFHVDAPCAL